MGLGFAKYWSLKIYSKTKKFSIQLTDIYLNSFVFYLHIFANNRIIQAVIVNLSTGTFETF